MRDRDENDPDDDIQRDAEHAAWVDDGMEGDCPLCGEPSETHGSDGSCDESGALEGRQLEAPHPRRGAALNSDEGVPSRNHCFHI